MFHTPYWISWETTSFTNGQTRVVRASWLISYSKAKPSIICLLFHWFLLDAMNSRCKDLALKQDCKFRLEALWAVQPQLVLSCSDACCRREQSGAEFQTGRPPAALQGSGVQPRVCSLFQRGNDIPGLFEIRLSLQRSGFLEHQKMQPEDE